MLTGKVGFSSPLIALAFYACLMFWLICKQSFYGARTLTFMMLNLEMWACVLKLLEEMDLYIVLMMVMLAFKWKVLRLLFFLGLNCCREKQTSALEVAVALAAAAMR